LSTIGILGAFLGGILTLISPCSDLLLPAFFAYAFDGFGKLVSRTGLFYLGLCITLVPLGAGLGKLGSFLDSIRPTVMLCAGILIIIFGIMTVFGKGFAFRPAQDAVGKLSGTSAVSVLLLAASTAWPVSAPALSWAVFSPWPWPAAAPSTAWS